MEMRIIAHGTDGDLLFFNAEGETKEEQLKNIETGSVRPYSSPKDIFDASLNILEPILINHNVNAATETILACKENIEFDKNTKITKMFFETQYFFNRIACIIEDDHNNLKAFICTFFANPKTPEENFLEMIRFFKTFRQLITVSLELNIDEYKKEFERLKELDQIPDIPFQKININHKKK